jgi:hypothetical protein
LSSCQFVLNQRHGQNGHATQIVAAYGSRVDGHVEVYAKGESEEGVEYEGEITFIINHDCRFFVTRRIDFKFE